MEFIRFYAIGTGHKGGGSVLIAGSKGYRFELALGHSSFFSACSSRESLEVGIIGTCADLSGRCGWSLYLLWL